MVKFSSTVVTDESDSCGSFVSEIRYRNSFINSACGYKLIHYNQILTIFNSCYILCSFANTKMSDVESLVVGKYDNIEVKADSCIHTGKEFPIQWINEYAFYFQYAPGNDQIWVYDTIRNCLYQMYNNVPAGILNRASSKFGDKKEVYFNVDQDCLGFFDGNMIYPNAWGNICGDVRPIIWLNPMAFYLKWADGNEQIWVYEANKNTVLQLHTVGTNTVYEAMHHTKWTFRRS